MEKSKWIKTLCKSKENIKLNDLILPGTHNSGSYDFTDMIDLSDTYDNYLVWPVSKIIKNWVVNQSYNIYEQLKMGVRVLDIDISYYNNKYYISHSFAIDELDNVLKQLTDFNNEYGDLYVIKIVYRHEIEATQISELNELFYNTFENNYINPTEFPHPLTTPINQLMKDNKNMIIYMDGINIFYNQNLMMSSWCNKQNTNDCITYHESKLENDYKNYKNINSNSFIDMNWTLTPTYCEVIKGIVCCCNYYDLKTWIYYFNDNLPSFIENNKRNIYNINSISVDFITPDLVNIITKINDNILIKNE